MVSLKLNKLFKVLVEADYKIKGPVKKEDKIVVQNISKASEADYSGKIPYTSYKSIFLPFKEELYRVKKNKIEETKIKQVKTAVWGINILDLKAVGLYDIVFSKDQYYQKRRKNILVIGFSPIAPSEYEDNKVFSFKFEENILEHLRFDIFVIKNKKNKLQFFAGSHKGMDILEEASITDYKFIQFVGFIKEEGLDEKMVFFKKAIELLHDSKLWEELGELCLACGKCTIHCPTCFCYDLEYENKPNESIRKRTCGVCFFNEFAQIAGNHNYLPTIKDRIRFWYEHKFLRIPHEYKYPGCISCNRCTKVCPVEINIMKNMARLKKEFDEKNSL